MFHSHLVQKLSCMLTTYCSTDKFINSVSDYNHIQHCVNLLSNWSSENHLTLNPTKCKTMLFSRKRSHVNKFQPLFLGDSQIELVHSYIYLGVTLVSDLSWSAHIESICVKSKKLIGLLYHRFYGYADPSTIFSTLL